jgi:hypothetical protein
MSKELFEIIWEIRCGEFEFYQRSFKVFDSFEEAEAHGIKIQYQENDYLSFEEKADDGYYFELSSVRSVPSIDGYKFKLLDD